MFLRRVFRHVNSSFFPVFVTISHIYSKQYLRRLTSEFSRGSIISLSNPGYQSGFPGIVVPILVRAQRGPYPLLSALSLIHHKNDVCYMWSLFYRSKRSVNQSQGDRSAESYWSFLGDCLRNTCKIWSWRFNYCWLVWWKTGKISRRKNKWWKCQQASQVPSLVR